MIVKKSSLLLIALTALAVLYCADLSRRIDHQSIRVAVDLAFALTILAIGHIKFASIMNPVTLLAPFLFSHVFYGFQLSLRQEPLQPTVEISYYFFIVFYLLGCLVPIRVEHEHTTTPPRYARTVAHWTVALAFAVLLTEAHLNNGFPLYTLLIDRINIYNSMRFVPIAHYLIMLTALVPAVYYYVYKNGGCKPGTLIIWSLVVAFILLNTLSRQIMIFGFIAFALTYARLNPAYATSFLLRAGVVMALFFISFGVIRMMVGTADMTVLDYLKEVSEVPVDLDVNSIEVTYNLYTSLNLATLNQIHTRVDEIAWGTYTLRPIIDVLKLDHVFHIGAAERLDTFAMLGTILADPYLDFGLAGVPLVGLLYGILGMYLYKLSSRRLNLGYMLMWSTFVFVMVMAVFANFFNAFFVWLCFGYSLLFLRQIALFPRRGAFRRA